MGCAAPLPIRGPSYVCPTGQSKVRSGADNTCHRRGCHGFVVGNSSRFGLGGCGCRPKTAPGGVAWRLPHDTNPIVRPGRNITVVARTEKSSACGRFRAKGIPRVLRLRDCIPRQVSAPPPTVSPMIWSMVVGYNFGDEIDFLGLVEGNEFECDVEVFLGDFNLGFFAVQIQMEGVFLKRAACGFLKIPLTLRDMIGARES